MPLSIYVYLVINPGAKCVVVAVVPTVMVSVVIRSCVCPEWRHNFQVRHRESPRVEAVVVASEDNVSIRGNLKGKQGFNLLHYVLELNALFGNGCCTENVVTVAMHLITNFRSSQVITKSVSPRTFRDTRWIKTYCYTYDRSQHKIAHINSITVFPASGKAELKLDGRIQNNTYYCA